MNQEKGKTNPQKIKHRMNNKFAVFPAVSANSKHVTHMYPNVEVNNMYMRTKRNIKPPRWWTVSVSWAFRKNPAG